VSSESFKDAIESLKADKISGSEEIVRKAIQIVDKEIESKPKMYTNINDLMGMLLEVSKIKKEMAALKNVLIYFIDFYKIGVPVVDLADRVLDKLDHQREQVMEKLIPYIKKSKKLMTFSRSSTIAHSLLKISEIQDKKNLPEVVLFESRPALEGKKFAIELSNAGYQVNYLVDAAMGMAMKTFKPDSVFIGADTIFPNGNVANKIGCHALALFAYQFKTPYYVVSTTLKLLLKTVPFPIQSYKSSEIWSKDSRPESVKVFNPYFEVIPANLITGYFTEFGMSQNIPDVKMEIEKDYIHKMYE
jgi:translation initiation factor 2B subunit (eIF-2B alpha/beta/delta family)